MLTRLDISHATWCGRGSHRDRLMTCWHRARGSANGTESELDVKTNEGSSPWLKGQAGWTERIDLTA